MGDGGFSTVERCCEGRENIFAQFKKMCIFALEISTQNRHSMKRIVLIFFLLVATLTTHAQVREFQIGALQNSIVRSVYADYQLIYTQPTVDSGFFILYRAGDPTAQAFRVPDKWEIHDVRIHNGAQVFFCGRCGGQALVGSFVIPVAFSGAGGLDYYLCGWSNGGYVLPTDFQRMDLYRSGDTVCMAMTGTSMWFRTSPQPNTTVASAYFIGSTCYMKFYINKGYYIKFTDGNSAFVPNTARWHLEETDDPTDWIRKKTTPYSVNVFNVRVDRVCQ